MVKILDQAVVKKGNIHPVRQGIVPIRLTLKGADLDAAEDADVIPVLLSNKVHVVKIPPKRKGICHRTCRYFGAPEQLRPSVPHPVVMVGDTEQVKPAGDGGLNDGLRRVLPAEGVVGMGVKILDHKKLLKRFTPIIPDFCVIVKGQIADFYPRSPPHTKSRILCT